MERKNSAAFDLDALLHPSNAFAHPCQVVDDPDLSLQEKRAILASWASDACAIEAAHDLRLGPSGAPVRWDDIMDALKSLDAEAGSRGIPRAGLWPLRLRRKHGDDESIVA
jgi:hypothetical protein